MKIKRITKNLFELMYEQKFDGVLAPDLKLPYDD